MIEIKSHAGRIKAQQVEGYQLLYNKVSAARAQRES